MGYRARLIRFVTFLGGVYFFLEFLLPERSGFGSYHDQISIGFQTIGSMALALGVINLLLHHGSRIVFRRTGSFNSASLLFGMFLMATVVAFDWTSSRRAVQESGHYAMLGDFALRIESDEEAGTGKLPAHERNALLLTSLREHSSAHRDRIQNATSVLDETVAQAALALQKKYEERLVQCSDAITELPRTDSSQELKPDDLPDYSPNYKGTASCLRLLSAEYRALAEFVRAKSIAKQFHDLLFQGLFVALGSAMFSLLGFYIAGAAYRAFRVQTFESACMMIAAFIVMLGQIPFGLWIWEGFPELRNWLLAVPSTAAFRAIKIGAAVAGLIMAFRMWLSIESGSFSQEKKP